jgi:cob(I)alamin adenosyltransferase
VQRASEVEAHTERFCFLLEAIIGPRLAGSEEELWLTARQAAYANRYRQPAIVQRYNQPTSAILERTMGHRLSKIYTRTGDQGTTGLGDGARVPKTHARIEAYGTVDEANCVLGMVLSVPGLPTDVVEVLTRIQHELFDLGGELAVPGHHIVTDAHVERLEQDLDRFNAPLPPLKEFILPGGGPAASACHLARSTTRRAERRVWALAAQEDIPPQPARYLNRLSDLLFVIARVLARHEHGAEVLWRHVRKDKSG